jgi:hypothetical protein
MIPQILRGCKLRGKVDDVFRKPLAGQHLNALVCKGVTVMLHEMILLQRKADSKKIWEHLRLSGSPVISVKKLVKINSLRV